MLQTIIGALIAIITSERSNFGADQNFGSGYPNRSICLTQPAHLQRALDISWWNAPIGAYRGLRVGWREALRFNATVPLVFIIWMDRMSSEDECVSDGVVLHNP